MLDIVLSQMLVKLSEISDCKWRDRCNSENLKRYNQCKVWYIKNARQGYFKVIVLLLLATFMQNSIHWVKYCGSLGFTSEST